ncbi:MAG TPA: hypothetical protein VM869_18570 [Enhygromyxa sp.]|nr:hypothetical protein [Enhygromyxa sp.]
MLNLRTVGLALAVICGCGESPAPTPSAEPNLEVAERALERHDAALARIASERETLAARYKQASTAEQAKIRAQARELLEDTIIEEVFPAWLGMPWGMGSDSTATRPHEPGMKVGCSYFVTSVLLAVGVELENRFTFAQAPAIHIQRSLAPDEDSLHRYFSIPAEQLRDRIAALGDGLYIIGLDTHVGFVVVRDGEVRFVHASYTGARVVSDELLVESVAIANSRPKGYFVTPLFQDGRLVDLWLRGQSVPFQRLGA